MDNERAGMSDLKFCKDCKHYRRRWGWAMCNAVREPVTGGPGAFADIQRRPNGLTTDCGPEAKRFEPKPPRRGFFDWLLNR